MNPRTRRPSSRSTAHRREGSLRTYQIPVDLSRLQPIWIPRHSASQLIFSSLFGLFCWWWFLNSTVEKTELEQAHSDHGWRGIHRLASGGRTARRGDSRSGPRQSLAAGAWAGRQRPDYLSRDVELIVGDVRDPDVVRQSLKGIDAVFHFAAAVGVGQSMYEIAEYTSVNNVGTAVLLEQLAARPGGAADRRLEHEHLRRGPLPAGRQRCTRAPSAFADQLRARRLGGAQRHRRSAHAGADAGDEAAVAGSVYALSKYDQERMCLMVGRRLRHPDGRAALLQRLRHAAGAVESVHGRAGDLRLAATQRQPPADLRGRPAAARFRQRARRGAGVPAGARGAGSRRARCSTSAAASRTRSREIAERMARVLGKDASRAGDHGQVPGRRHPALLRRHLARADGAGLRAAQVTLEDGLAELAGWLEGQDRARPCGRGAAPNSTARGLTV